MISFTQNLISINSREAKICWIVENHTENTIRNADAFSSIFSHNFGDLGTDSIKSISFRVPIAKCYLLGSAFLNYTADGETYEIKSNILRNL